MIKHKFLEELREKIRTKNDNITHERIKWINSNPCYYDQIVKSLRFVIEKDSRILHIRCSIGYILNELKPGYGLGVDDSPLQIEEAKKNYQHLNFLNKNIEDLNIAEKFDYILISSVEDIVDLKAVFDCIKRCCTLHTRIILIHYNYLWTPLVKLAEATKMKYPQKLHNWITSNDLKNLLVLSNYKVVSSKRIVLYPFYIPLISYLLNRFIAPLPLFRIFTLMHLTVARCKIKQEKEYSVSVIIPCKNEAGNIEDAVKRIPPLGNHTEIIFCDDKSTDGTVEKVKEIKKKHPDKDIKLVEGPGICKAENVWTGFDVAGGDILMILDADLTVLPEELPYFYESISEGYGEFINGSRLVYPAQDDAMRLFNEIGNKFFSLAFSYILDTQIKDTLCGTKVLWKRDYDRIKKNRGSWGINDKWGDYELLFGAAKCHLDIIDLPVHYVDRTYGETKMTNRFKNGCIMLRMSIVALLKIKFH